MCYLQTLKENHMNHTVDKYIALQNTTNWIENSSSEEFMSLYNKLGDDYSGTTVGEILGIDEADETSKLSFLFPTSEVVIDETSRD